MKVDFALFMLGRRKSASYLVGLPKLAVDGVPDEPLKVYLNAQGSEVHVRGDDLARVTQSETLAEKIARFDRLAATVRQSRAAMMSFASDFEEGDGYTDEELIDDAFADDGQDFDDFGDPIDKSSGKPLDVVAPADKPAAPQQAGPASEQEADASEADVE